MNTFSRRTLIQGSTVVAVIVWSLSTAVSQTSPQSNRPPARLQSAANAGTVTGVVTDPTGAIVPHATVTLSNAVSGFSQNATTDDLGSYTLTNVPFNTYKLAVSSDTLAPSTQTINVQSRVPITQNVVLQVMAASTTVEVTATGGDLVETDPVDHTDIDRGLFSKIPLESGSSSVSSLVTLAAPGVSADSNGLFHGMGD